MIRVAALWLFGLLVTIAAAVVTIQLVNTNLYGPQQPVRDYMQALQNGDGSRALGLLGIDPPNASPALLDGQALKAAVASISDLAVGTPTKLDDGRVRITVSYQLDGEGHSSDFTLEPAGVQWMFFHKWKFLPTSLPVMDVSVVNQTEAAINGVAVPMPAGKNTFSLLYPGRYEAGFENQLFTAKPSVAVVNSPASKPTPITLVTEPTPALLGQVDKALKQFVDKCAQQKVLKPSGCPLNTDTNNQVTSEINWSIVEYPKASITAYNGSWVIAPLKFKAKVQFQEKSYATGAISTVEKIQDHYFTARLAINGEQVTVTPVVKY